MMKRFVAYFGILLFIPCIASDKTTFGSLLKRVKNALFFKLDGRRGYFYRPYDRAKNHMDPALAACEDLTCIKNLVDNSEQQAAKQFLDEHEVTAEQQERFNAEFADLSAYNPLYSNDCLPEPGKQFHDTKVLGQELVDETVNVLKEYSINATAVKIAFDKQHFEKNSISACGGSPGFGYSAHISYDVEGINGRRVNIHHKHLILHEVVHVKELHQLKRHLARSYTPQHKKFVETDLYKNPSSVPLSYLKWTRTQELQAELYPLLDFGSQGVFDDFVDGQVARCSWKTLSADKWGKSSRLATHPECTELLPYIVKIEELEKRGVKPLRKRLR